MFEDLSPLEEYRDLVDAALCEAFSESENLGLTMLSPSNQPDVFYYVDLNGQEERQRQQGQEK